MNLEKIHNVYFIGIGGIGMSALARYFKRVGKAVAGYDRSSTPLTTELSQLGIDIHFKDSLEAVPTQYHNAANTLIVYTPAIGDTHTELHYFKTNDFLVLKRAQVVGMVANDSVCMAVAGTHGKTTTSSILAHLLRETKTSFLAFLGGISEDFDSNFVMDGTDYAVVEADEFDRSFLHLKPNIACITSMDADHLDIYGTPEELKKTFLEFAAKCKPDGKLLVKQGLALDGITFGLDEISDYRVNHIKIEDGSYVFDLITPTQRITKVRFNKPGHHNLLNGLAAFAMAAEAGFSEEKLAKALQSFKGVQRRFSYQIKQNNFVFIDDYAHHPTEIDAVYQAVKEMHPNKEILAVFQPHLFSRTQDFAEEFAASLSRFDTLLLLDIYPAREEPIIGVTTDWLMEKIENPNKRKVLKSELVKEIQLQNPQVLITMGAGDIGLVVPQLKKELAYAS